MTTNFDKQVEEHQVKWRAGNISNQDWGKQNGVRRAWLLPKGMWEEGLWPGIRSSSPHSLPAYLEKYDVEKHDGVHNLKSSWMLCANLYFPFQKDTEMLAGFLKEHVSPDIKRVDAVELEYAEEPPLDPTTLLGEPAKGKRGKHQTSPDVAFVVTTQNDGKGIILTENKFTEHSFYDCSGRKPEHGNPAPSRCRDFQQVYDDLENVCYQLNWEKEGRPNRKYWDCLKISDKGKTVLKRCPAADSGCQLFRQQALAEGIAKSEKYELVISCVAYDERNKTLIYSMKKNGIGDFTKDWAGIFDGRARFASFSHQQWINWVKKHDNQGRWQDWLVYVKDRYDL